MPGRGDQPCRCRRSPGSQKTRGRTLVRAPASQNCDLISAGKARDLPRVRGSGRRLVLVHGTTSFHPEGQPYLCDRDASAATEPLAAKAHMCRVSAPPPCALACRLSPGRPGESCFHRGSGTRCRGPLRPAREAPGIALPDRPAPPVALVDRFSRTRIPSARWADHRKRSGRAGGSRAASAGTRTAWRRGSSTRATCRCPRNAPSAARDGSCRCRRA